MIFGNAFACPTGSKAYRQADSASVARRVICLSVSILGLVAGCTSASDLLYEPHEVESQIEAGTTNVAVVYVEALTDNDALINALTIDVPPDQMSFTELLNSVLPTTSIVIDQLIRAFGASAQVGLPRTSTTGTETTDIANGVPSQTVQIVNNLAPGEAPDPAEPPEAELPSSGLGATTIDDDATLDQDPILASELAVALGQERALLERLIACHASQQDHTAYVVRLNVATIPFARNQPYDAYTSVSFFTELSPDVGTDNTFATAPEQPVVVPMLVTDNLEASLASRTALSVLQLALALNGLTSGVAFDASAALEDSDLRSLLASDLNANLTVTRQSENTMLVRLGAVNAASVQYGMISRNHPVSLILLVPNKYLDIDRTIRIGMKTTIRHAITGEVLPEIGDYRKIEERVQEIGDRFGIPESYLHNVDLIFSLAVPVGANNFQEFASMLRRVVPEGLGDFRALAVGMWTALADLSSSFAYQTATFDLPNTPTPSTQPAVAACSF